MTMMTLTAVFDTRAEADRAAARLVSDAHVDRAHIEIHAQTASAGAAAQTEDTGFFGSLKNLFVSEEDRVTYSEAIRRGGFLLTARIDEAQEARAVDVLESEGGVDMDHRESEWRAQGWTGAAATTAGSGTTMAGQTGRVAHADGSETIEVVEERLQVGKRAVAGGRVRVRSYLVETPVEEQVSLHSEQVSIERRPVDRPLRDGERATFEDRTIEMTETAEQAVIAKTAHVVEEVVVRKSAQDRVETVKDSVRRTEIEVEDDRTAAKTKVDVATTAPMAPRRT